MQKLDFTKIHDHFAGVSKEIFDESGSVSPILFALQIAPTESGEMTIERGSILNGETFEQMFSGEDGKRNMMKFIRDVIDNTTELHQHFIKTMEINVNAVVQISEAWVGTAKPDAASVTPPSEDPNRGEAVIIAIHNQWCKTIVGVHNVVEQPKRHLQLNSLSDTAVVSGSLVNNPNASPFGPH